MSPPDDPLSDPPEDDPEFEEEGDVEAVKDDEVFAEDVPLDVFVAANTPPTKPTTKRSATTITIILTTPCFLKKLPIFESPP